MDEKNWQKEKLRYSDKLLFVTITFKHLTAEGKHPGESSGYSVRRPGCEFQYTSYVTFSKDLNLS